MDKSIKLNSNTIIQWIIVQVSIVLIVSACGTSSDIRTQSSPETIEPIKLPTQFPSATVLPSVTTVPSPTVTAFPVGTMLIHQSLINGYSQFELVDLDYETRLQITDANVDHSRPSWTPDGKSIVYQMSSGATSEIHIMSWDGISDKKLSREENAREFVPVVSPDGSQISFFASYPGHWALFLMNIDGGNQHTITDNTVFESIASWSPDSLSIAFTPWHNTMAPPFIASVSSDGKRFRELTTRDVADRDPKYSPGGNMIIFTCYDDSLPQICTMKTDGTGRIALTSKPGGNDNPVWSPDGNEIAFVSWRDSVDPNNCQGGDCNFDVHVMNSDGSNQRRVTDNDAEDWYPAWSNDGAQIAFVSLRDEPRHPAECGDSCNSEIYVMNKDGAEVRRVTNNSVPDWNPIWRPPVSEDSAKARSTETSIPPAVEIGGGRNQIVYWAQADSPVNIYLIGLQGESEVPITLGEGQSAAWSPDGSQVAFVDYTSNDQTEIFIMNADGSDRRQVTKSQNSSRDPAWSPDGEFIAYSRGHLGIFMSDIHGENEHLVVSGDGDYYAPSWSPDGKQIVFLVNQDQLSSTLFTVNRDGSNVRTITGSANWSSYPDWSPDGEWISFSSYRDDNWEIYIMKSDGSDQRRITYDWLQNFEPAWRP
jgi:Tol biopolymer transport system component